MIKKILLFLVFSLSTILAQGEAKGLFMSVSVGPRIPVSNFSESRNLGMGIDLGFSYTDIGTLPVFLYTKFGYQHFPGKQEFYKTSDYSAISTNLYSINPGVRLFLNPISDKIVLLMPVIDLGVAVNYTQTYNEFKLGTNKPSFDDNKLNYGFHVGVGFSMFMLDVMAYYNYVPTAQFIALDLSLRIPIFATM